MRTAPEWIGTFDALRVTLQPTALGYHWASLPQLWSGELDTTIDYPWQGQTLRLPGYRVGERIVWGLTHRMLSILFERLADRSGL